MTSPGRVTGSSFASYRDFRPGTREVLQALARTGISGVPLDVPGAAGALEEVTFHLFFVRSVVSCRLIKKKQFSVIGRFTLTKSTGQETQDG
ncbi:hypothetical protein ElyMa_005018800 [Elysia marginata]|uniref:Uncharacterized protein n=1 Tax=Elysia marginata TaxID=1093978 RepID=A0AAV4J800_9GAST|nr:hypothetical protein ElyMa_005018800 [Elysia marginata]